MLHPPHFSLGAELAREQDRVFGDMGISELDLIRGIGRARMRLIRRYRRFAIGVLGLFAVATAVTALVVFGFPVVRCTIQGAATTRASDSAAGSEASRGDGSTNDAGKEVGDEGFGRWVVASAREPKQVNFSDGSVMRLAVGSRARLVGTNRRGASVTLESGSAELRVAGSRFTEYLVGVGPFSLAAVRGRLELSWDPMNELLDLVVHEGYVVISGCQFGPGRSVVAGKELGTRCITR